MIILKMCFSVNQIDDLQSSNKKQSWTFRLPWYEPKICLFDGSDFWNFHESQKTTTIDRLFMKKY